MHVYDLVVSYLFHGFSWSFIDFMIIPVLILFACGKPLINQKLMGPGWTEWSGQIPTAKPDDGEYIVYNSYIRHESIHLLPVFSLTYFHLTLVSTTPRNRSLGPGGHYNIWIQGMFNLIIWVKYNDLTATSLGMVNSRGWLSPNGLNSDKWNIVIYPEW